MPDQRTPVCRWPSLAALSLLFPCALVGAEPRFNRDVRPILSDRCFACHGPDKGNRKTKMRLDVESDSRADLGRGRFPVVPGDPAKSEIFRRVTATSKGLRMPPASAGHDALKPAEIEILRRWIESGAKYEPHWSFVPPQRAALPQVSDAGWTKNAIDAFVLSRLQREGLEHSAEADKLTLIRRLTLDLTGLPPTPAEVRAFEADQSPGAYEAIVDRLLASPRYGERMAVRWLEAARYADTNGYQTDGPRQMWRWRDWVIDAFNRNMPYDRFTVEQIAGDLLPNATTAQRLATAFNRNHRTSAEGGIVDEEFRVEYVADRAETTSTVWLGLTVGCARCHDHKFDPITQKDYYSLFAFFNNVPEKGFVWNFGNEEPAMKAPLPHQQARLEILDRKLAAAQHLVESLQPDVQRERRKWEKRAAKGSAIDWSPPGAHRLMEGMPAGCETAPCAVPHESGPQGQGVRFSGKDFLQSAIVPKLDYRDPFTLAAWVRPDTPDGAILSKGEDYFEGQQHALYVKEGKLRLHVTFRWTDLAMRLETAEPLRMGEWQHVAVTYDGGMKASGVRMYVNGAPQKLNVLFDQLLWPMDSKEPWRVGAGGGLRFQGGISEALVYPRALSAAEVSTLAVTESVNAIAVMPAASRSRAQQDKLSLCFLDRFAPDRIRRARWEVENVTAARRALYSVIPSVMVMQDREQPRETHLLKRGAYDAPGDIVTPSVPSMLPPLRPEWPRNRLGLAKWIVDRNNPLTARATVNRYWAMLFGVGLVKTVEDFGSQGEWPINQDLLDWLAVEFMDSGWNVKHILKTMVMSAAYRQSSKVTPDLVQRDPENRLLARGPRYRLPAEVIRDQALSVSGLLVEKLGGPSVKPYQPAGLWQELQGGKTGYQEDAGAGLYRRSLYTYWRRTIAPPNMANFDSPTRETCVIRESRTNTPLQALNLMNDVAFLEASRKLAERMIDEGGSSPETRLDRGWQLVLARKPGTQERTSLANALRKFEDYYQANPSAANAFLRQGRSAIPGRLNASELAAYAGAASILLNLDETITKE